MKRVMTLTKQEYTISEVILMTRLTDRTIRNYIKLGLLEGEKKNGVWVFTKEQVSKMMSEPYVKQAIQIKRDVMIDHFLKEQRKKEASLCSVLDYPSIQENVAQRLCDTAIDYMNTQKPKNVELSYSYDHQACLARFIVKGPTQRVMELLQIIRQQAEEL